MIGMIDMIGMIEISAKTTIEALELALDELEQCDPRELDAENDSIEEAPNELGDQIAMLALDGAF